MLLTVHVEKSLGTCCIAGPVGLQRAQCGPNFASQVSTSTEERWPIRSVFRDSSPARCYLFTVEAFGWRLTPRPGQPCRLLDQRHEVERLSACRRLRAWRVASVMRLEMLEVSLQHRAQPFREWT